MKKLFVFLIAVLTLALMGCGGDAPKKDAAAPAGGDKQVLNLFSWADNFDPERRSLPNLKSKTTVK